MKKTLITTAFIFSALSISSVYAQEETASEAKNYEKPAAPEGQKELELELPQPLFVGTPQNIMSDNLEEANIQRDPVYIPEEAELLSVDTWVTSSDSAPIIGELEMVTDGDKDGNEGSYVELGPGKQWIQIELDEPAEIHAIAIWHFHSQARAYQDVVVQIASDPDILENVSVPFNNDHDNSLGLGIGKDKEWIETYEGRMIDVDGVKGQYIRLYSDGSTSNPMNHYIEVEIYGVPATDE